MGDHKWLGTFEYGCKQEILVLNPQGDGPRLLLIEDVNSQTIDHIPPTLGDGFMLWEVAVA